MGQEQKPGGVLTRKRPNKSQPKENIMQAIFKTALLFILAAVAGTAVPYAHAAGLTHGHGEHPPKLQLNNGEKWTTDEALRSNMGTMRAMLGDHLEAIHRGKLTQNEYKQIGARIEQHVGKIVAECKLEPKADAMLHIVVADLTAGADAMQGKTKTAPSAGAHKVVEALNAYGMYFQHPGWQPLK